jgi:hypothetical protein
VLLLSKKHGDPVRMCPAVWPNEKQAVTRTATRPQKILMMSGGREMLRLGLQTGATWPETGGGQGYCCRLTRQTRDPMEYAPIPI